MAKINSPLGERSYLAASSCSLEVLAQQKLIISTNVEAKLINYAFKKIHFELELKDQKIHRFTIHNKQKTESYINVS